MQNNGTRTEGAKVGMWERVRCCYDTSTTQNMKSQCYQDWSWNGWQSVIYRDTALMIIKLFITLISYTSGFDLLLVSVSNQDWWVQTEMRDRSCCCMFLGWMSWGRETGGCWSDWGVAENIMLMMMVTYIEE